VEKERKKIEKNQMGQTYSKEINIANSKACTELDPSWQK